MWLWESELQRLGFRRRSERYWQCERRFGLPAWGHLSIFPWSEHALSDNRLLIELDTFHVTFAIEGEHVHFYYHEASTENDWEPGGHTSSAEICRLQRRPRSLRAQADEIAALLIAALAGALRPRRR